MTEREASPRTPEKPAKSSSSGSTSRAISSTTQIAAGTTISGGGSTQIAILGGQTDQTAAAGKSDARNEPTNPSAKPSARGVVTVITQWARHQRLITSLADRNR